MYENDNSNELLKKTLSIFDKHDELSIFRREIFKDKSDVPFLKMALFEENRAFDNVKFLSAYTSLKNESYFLERKEAIENSDLYAGKYYYNKFGYLHNINGPAITTNNGTNIYLVNGKIHREDGPAIMFKDPEKDLQVHIYYRNNILHREYGPAKVVHQDGQLYKSSYYINGKLHRENSPAIEWTDGQYMYYVDGKRHCEDGPAVRLKTPGKPGKFTEEYWINDEKISYLTFKIHKIREKIFSHNTNEKNKL